MTLDLTCVSNKGSEKKIIIFSFNVYLPKLKRYALIAHGFAKIDVLCLIMQQRVMACIMF